MKPSGPDIQYLKATPADLNPLLTWIERYYAFDHIPFDPEKIKLAVSQLLQNDQFGVAYFAHLDGRTVGYFLLTYSFDIEYGGRHATLTDLFLDETTRRTGIGSRTLQLIEDLCRHQNISTLFLLVEIDNIEAQSFYKKMGFDLHTRYSMSKAITQDKP